MYKKILATLLILPLLGVGCEPVVTPEETQVIPLSGTWNFELSASTSYLSGERCPSGGGGGGPISGGPAELSVSDDAEVASLHVDGQLVVFHNNGNGFYQSGTRLFPVPHQGGMGAGTVYFDFMANTDDSIVGTLHWNNGVGCRGDYPFTMELVDVTLGDYDTELYVLSEGEWSLELSEEANDCDGEIAGFSGMPTTITLQHNLNLDTGEPDPIDITLEPLGAILEQLPDTNVYGQTSTPFDVGSPVNAEGDVLLDYEDQNFTGVIELEALGPNELTGTVYISSGSCSLSATVGMAFVN